MLQTIVLLPGLNGNGVLFESFVAALGSEYSIQIVEYPPDQILGYGELTALVKSYLPIEGEYIVLGESFSGPIAFALAKNANFRLKGLVLSCSFVTNPRPSLYWLNPVVSILPFKPRFVGLLGRLLLGGFYAEPIARRIERSICLVSTAVLRSRLTSVLSLPTHSRGQALNVPVLYLEASHDRLVPKAAQIDIARLVPDLRVASLDGPHFLLQCLPTESAAAVLKFCRAHFSSSASLTLRTLTGQPDEITAVKHLFDAAPRYAKFFPSSIVDVAQVTDIFSSLPDKKSAADKFVFGVYQAGVLVGFVDLIRSYPSDSTAYIGLLLIPENHEGRGLGRAIFSELETLVQQWPSIKSFQLGIIRTNTRAVK